VVIHKITLQKTGVTQISVWYWRVSSDWGSYGCFIITFFQKLIVG